MNESTPKVVIDEEVATVSIGELDKPNRFGYRPVTHSCSVGRGGVMLANDSPGAPICFDQRYYMTDMAVDLAAALVTAVKFADGADRPPRSIESAPQVTAGGYTVGHALAESEARGVLGRGSAQLIRIGP
ncbi:hypothetical protein [Amycolatopsis sp. TNS106]|uniref:hypothetical protein n=1 Tax=Amycolatopsis sp. TNS106 TaxID=2861750 RepID=UPI001C577CBB|nr:hypothetical protein [Amycolatopsis sp. TNS106]QXV57425.1 hypothetical protein CVV72_10780 [Amycolatopsis sp. TNS106]